jgi:branched-chain amino acid transport system substrate-binding protein
VVGGAALLLGLAACGSSSSTQTTATTAGGVSTTAAVAACPVGDVTQPQTLKIGFFGALTGSNSPQLGINAANGVQLAICEHNQKSSAKVQYIPYDSQGDGAQAPQLAQRAITDKVTAIVGPTYSGESKTADPVLEQAGIPHVTASATNVLLASHGWQYFYRALANDDAQGPADAQWMTKKIGAKTAAVIDDSSDYGKGLADTVRSELKTAGVKIPVSEAIDPKQQAYLSTVNKINAAKVDAVFYGGYYQQAGPFLKQLRDAGVTAPFVSGDGSNDQKLVDGAGASAAEGAITTCACSVVNADPKAQAFVGSYKAAFKTDPGTYSAEAYDVANLILAGIDAGSTDTKALNTYIKGASYVGLTKTLKFDAKGEVQGGQIYVYQIKSGVLTELGPLAQALGS